MLQKLMGNRGAGVNKKDSLQVKRDRQLDREEIERSKLRGIKKQEKELHETEYNNLKQRDHRLALNILEEERKSLEEQLAEYKRIIHSHEIGESKLTDVELTGIYRLYEHLMLQRRELDQHIARFDKKTMQQISRDKDKESLIKMLAKKYSDIDKPV